MFKAKLRAIKLWKQRLNIASAQTDLTLLDGASSSLKSEKTKGATSGADSRSLKIQLARFEVLEKEKDILEEDYQTSLAFSEDLLVQLQQIKRAKCQNCAQTTKVLKPSQSQQNAQSTVNQQSHAQGESIPEEAIESSISNIEMSKSEKSLQKPLMNAVSTLPKAPLLAQNKSPKTNPSLHEQSTVSNLHNNSHGNREPSQKTVPSSQY